MKPDVRLVALVVTTGVAALVGTGCEARETPPPPRDAEIASDGSSSALTPTASASRAEDPQPVFPADGGAPEPTAQRFCGLVQGLPERRRAECCPGTPTGFAPVADCVRTLSVSLRDGAVTLGDADVSACDKAMVEATTECNGALTLRPFPSACDGIIKGALGEGRACRSSLECAAGLRCQGLSAVTVGKCLAPSPPGPSCDVAVDVLAGFTRQDRFSEAHPECAGYCLHHRCEAPLAADAPCNSHSMCGLGAHCIGHRCTSAALPAAGEACAAGTCAPGATCIEGKCGAPKPDGARCGGDEECAGRCERADGGTGGSCVRACPRAIPVRVPLRPKPARSR